MLRGISVVLILLADEEELSSNLSRGGSRERTYGPARGVSPAVNAISALHEIGQKVKRSVGSKLLIFVVLIALDMLMKGL